MVVPPPPPSPLLPPSYGEELLNISLSLSLVSLSLSLFLKTKIEFLSLCRPSLSLFFSLLKSLKRSQVYCLKKRKKKTKKKEKEGHTQKKREIMERERGLFASLFGTKEDL